MIDRPKGRHTIAIRGVCGHCKRLSDDCIRFKKILTCPDCLNPEYKNEIPLYQHSAFANAENTKPIKTFDIWYHRVVDN